jgi:uncharacterized membrane protein YgcG
VKCFFLPLTVLAFAATLQAAEPPDPATAACVVVAMVLAQRQASVTPQAPACHVPGCACVDCGAYCVQLDGKCACPALSDDAAPLALSLLVISRSDCPPCAKLLAELKAHGDALEWDVWKNSPKTEAKYGGVTAYPTIILLRDGKETARRVGYASVEELTAWANDPEKPITEGENVGRNEMVSGGDSGRSGYSGGGGDSYGVARPAYAPMMQPMRFYQGGGRACGT